MLVRSNASWWSRMSPKSRKIAIMGFRSVGEYAFLSLSNFALSFRGYHFKLGTVAGSFSVFMYAALAFIWACLRALLAPKLTWFVSWLIILVDLLWAVRCCRRGAVAEHCIQCFDARSVLASQHQSHRKENLRRYINLREEGHLLPTYLPLLIDENSSSVVPQKNCSFL